MKLNLHYRNKGYTIVEMTVMILVGLMISATALSLMSNQISAFNILKTQNFLIADAPQINNTLNRIVSRGSAFRIYPSFADAVASTNPTIVNGNTLVIVFQSSGQINTATLVDPTVIAAASTYGVIDFDPVTNSLDYYYTDNLASIVYGSPSWNISKQATSVVHTVLGGVLRTTISGPNAESITYSTTTQR
ncbi:MAG: PulJ/GspJ family protein [Akkermansiaceae bacterium]